MTVNSNVRCIEWFDVSNTTPTGCRFVLGFYEDGHIRRCRLNGDEWFLDNYGPGELRHEFAKPTHWCEFPDGPDLDLYEECPECEGSGEGPGKFLDGSPRHCSHCGGSGAILQRSQSTSSGVKSE